MLKVRRTIYVNDRQFTVWLGLVNKNKQMNNYTVYLISDDPNSSLSHAEKILSGIESKEEAIKKGVSYTKRLYRNILDNQDNQGDE
ncbi:MAG: hypothetical protein LBM07_01090 [Culturomica sp.]|jgi:hypothetical protein|nr:hypothetical protein [Culturomica sp.]